MSTEENKATFRRYIEGCNKGNSAVLDEYLADTCIAHLGNNDLHGIEAVRQQFVMVRTAFPDLHMTIEDMLAEGDQVAGRLKYTATHKGVAFDIPPTGKQVTNRGLFIYRISEGKYVEYWEQWDLVSLYQQIITVPPE